MVPSASPRSLAIASERRRMMPEVKPETEHARGQARDLACPRSSQVLGMPEVKPSLGHARGHGIGTPDMTSGLACIILFRHSDFRFHTRFNPAPRHSPASSFVLGSWKIAYWTFIFDPLLTRLRMTAPARSSHHLTNSIFLLPPDVGNNTHLTHPLIWDSIWS